MTSSDELDELFETFGDAGIEVIDADQTYLRDEYALDRTADGAGPLELDLTPGALDKTDNPLRRYLSEIGTVPLLTREGEGDLARRIERGQLAVLKSISRTPLIARKVIALGDRLHSGDRTIREVVSFTREAITDERMQARAKQVQQQIDAVRHARGVGEARRDAAEHAEGRDAQGPAAVPPPAVGRDAGARRVLERHSQDSVHGRRQAPAG
jgi:RNA polymerase primary sigma factor